MKLHGVRYNFEFSILVPLVIIGIFLQVSYSAAKTLQHFPFNVCSSNLKTIKYFKAFKTSQLICYSLLGAVSALYNCQYGLNGR